MPKLDMKKLKSEPLHRSITIDGETRAGIDEDGRTVEVAFSSEEPYMRWFGNEILDHSSESIRLGRLQSGGAVLVDHDTRDHVGVVESVRIDGDRRGRAVLRFGRGARATEVFDDVRDGIRSLISVGYKVHDMAVDSRGESGEPDTYRVSDWEPLEISLVAVPADASVGVGRSEETLTVKEEKPMTESTKAVEPQTPPPAEPKVDVREIEQSATKREQERIREIQAIGRSLDVDEMAAAAVNNGVSIDEFRAQVVSHMEKAKPIPSADVGMSEKEVKDFSWMRAINALANPSDRRAQEAAAFEFECSRAASEVAGKESQGIMIPMDVLQRDLTVGTATDGGHTVATDLLSGSFIDMLRNRALMMQLGTPLTGLVGNVAIPRQTGGATAYWVAESGNPTESQQAFDQVTLSPETVGAFTDVSRKLLLQSSIDVEALVRSDLATTLALEIDRVAIEGSGAGNEPQGILGTSGIGDVAGGTNGLAPTWSHIVELETGVSVANADVGRLAYVTNANARGKLKTTAKDAGSGLFVWGDSNMLNGYDARVTNQVPADLTKGTGTNLSAIIFANWADLLVGMWGGLDLLVDPYTASTSGTVRVVVHQDVDVAVRHAESFSAMQDAITA